MTAITHAVATHGAQLKDGLVRFFRGMGETFAMMDAAIRVAGAIDRHQDPHPADLKALGLKAPPPRFY